MKTWMDLNLLEPSHVYSLTLVNLYDLVMLVLLLIMGFVGWLFFMWMINQPWSHRFETDHLYMEVCGSLIPSLIIMSMAILSLKTLFYQDDKLNSSLSISCLSSQWSWEYMYNNWPLLSLTNTMLEDSNSLFYLLECKQPLVLPINTLIDLNITSSDVLHSWTVPSMGVKVDSVPGRINQIILISSKVGSVFGQCSELCGTNHSKMPIHLEFITIDSFMKWLDKFHFIG